MTPLNASDVTKAVEAMLVNAAQDPLSLLVERAEPVNEQPSRCPWVGVYRSEMQLPSRTLGAGPGYRQQKIGLVLVAQQSHPEKGSECEVLLESLVQFVLATLLGDESLGGLVDMIDQLMVTYANYGQVESAYMQTAIIQLVGISNSGG